MTSHTHNRAFLDDLARAHLFAKRDFQREFSRFFREDVEPCSDETGWQILARFRGEVERFRFKLGRTERGIEQAAEEIFRLELVGESDYRFEALVAFVKWYRLLKTNIEGAIEHLFEFQGDAFADLVDALPLAGRELVERALASHWQSERPRREGFLDYEELSSTVLEQLGSSWHSLICGSENYISTALETACRKGFLHRVKMSQEQATA